MLCNNFQLPIITALIAKKISSPKFPDESGKDIFGFKSKMVFVVFFH